jgi:hypothetical protein
MKDQVLELQPFVHDHVAFHIEQKRPSKIKKNFILSPCGIRNTHDLYYILKFLHGLKQHNHPYKILYLEIVALVVDLWRKRIL